MLRLSLISLLLAFSASASADNFDYNYLSLGYGNTDFDGIGDGDGFTLGGSYAFNGKYHAFARYESAELASVIDATRWQAGVGYNRWLTERVDLVARLSYEYVEFDSGILTSVDDTGFGLSVGVRYRSSDKLELSAAIKRTDYSDFGDDTGIEVGALYKLTNIYSLGVRADWGDDVNTFTLSGRFYFGK